MLHISTRYMTPAERERAHELEEIDGDLFMKLITGDISHEEYEIARKPSEDEYEALRDLTDDRETEALYHFCLDRGMFETPHYLVDIEEEYDEIVHEQAAGRVIVVEEDETEFPRWKQGIPARARDMLVEKLEEFDADDVTILPVTDFPEISIEYVIMPLEAAFFARMKLTRDVFLIDRESFTPSAS